MPKQALTLLVKQATAAARTRTRTRTRTLRPYSRLLPREFTRPHPNLTRTLTRYVQHAKAQLLELIFDESLFPYYLAN